MRKKYIVKTITFDPNEDIEILNYIENISKERNFTKKIKELIQKEIFYKEIIDNEKIFNLLKNLNEKIQNNNNNFIIKSEKKDIDFNNKIVFENKKNNNELKNLNDVMNLVNNLNEEDIEDLF